MRKIIPYILILIALVGLLGPITNIGAQAEPTGDCYIYYGHATPPYSETKRGLTKSECDKFINKTGGTNATWFASNTSTAGATWRCYDGSGYSTTLNENECANKNFSWSYGPIKDRPETATPPTPVPGTGTTTSTTSDPKYYLLAPLPCTEGEGCVGGELRTFDPTGDNKVGAYLNLMIKLFIGICAVLAVIMIVMGGIQYMTSELISSKEAGKERIRNAIFGLLLALGAYTLLFTINPDLLNTDLKSLENVTVEVTLEEQIKSYSGQGTCEPITSGLCSPLNLASAGFIPEPSRGTQASSICNGESGGNSSLASGVDKCSDGNSFSFGLFQINIIAHANEIPGGVCSNIFQVNGGGTQGACMPGKSKDGICFERDCKVINQTQYQLCKSYITNPANNIAYALKLQTARGWGQWGANNSCHF